MPIILAVDDSPSMRRMVQETLREAGYDVLTAADGQDAVDMVGAHAVDFVVTDINMPRMDGITLVRALRAMPRYRHTPVLMLTTESDAVKQQARNAGASGWIAKPFNPDILVSAVRKFLG
jgi:two-component system chemotaxis response regulator CheY